MPWCKLDATARYHFKFNRLAASLGVRRAEARGLFFGLCSWAIVHAPDGRLDGFSEAEIEQAMDWQGRPGRCLHAMTQCSLIDRHATFWEIHGYYQNSGTFKDSEKKRKQRENSISVPGQSGDTERGLSQDCPPLEEKRREEREEIRTSEEAPAFVKQPDPDVLSLEKFYLEKRGGSGLLSRLPPKEKQALEVLVGLTTDPRKVIEHYLADNSDYYVRRKWPISVLVDNIGQHLGTGEKTSPRAANDVFDPSVSRREAFKAMSEDNKLRQQQNQLEATDPELAASKLREIMRKI